MTPACGYELEYAIGYITTEVGDPHQLPDWIVNTGGLTFSVQTNDPVNVAVYKILIIGSVPKMYMNPTYSEEIFIILHV